MAAAAAPQKLADIGVIGLAVMGENLVLNFESRGYTVAVYNRTTKTMTNFVEGRAKGKNIVGGTTLEEFVGLLAKPRKVMLMVMAGKVTDGVIDQVAPLLEAGDIIIDGGNSEFEDTNRRTAALRAKNLLFIGTGVSGGEEGALTGPSIMPGGNPAAWPAVKPLFQAISAKVADGTPCCDWVGDDGAGHYVKMVHNGIEYGDIQLICEAYQLLQKVCGFNNEQLAAVFNEWNKGDLDSYLIEIAAQIFAVKDDQDASGQSYVLDKILDTAGQKGTGKWTAVSALNLGMPLTLIGESVFARCLSAQKDERVAASAILPGVPEQPLLPAAEIPGFVKKVHDALLASKIVSYAQGFVLIKAAAQQYKWGLNYGNVALLWRGGCIIRSQFLGDIKNMFDRTPDISNMMLDPFFSKILTECMAGWREVAALAMLRGIPSPCITAGLTYYDGYRSARLPANLLQAQRDFFGAHQYERVDQPRGKFFHTNWTGRGGSTASNTYQV